MASGLLAAYVTELYNGSAYDLMAPAGDSITAILYDAAAVVDAADLQDTSLTTIALFDTAVTGSFNADASHHEDLVNAGFGTTQTAAAYQYDADDTTWTSAVSDTARDILLAYNTGATDPAATSDKPLAYWDGIGVVPTGGNITAQWSANGLFQFGAAS